ncbi:drebrin-like isoform X2 [Salvelinus fontinalis]|uniref:drebrin-like isoform X2 n=1 Tax=Salvelinus fontinalis TaxID=8038 RepID=UPI002485A718|nr:drebrin-like isoform X2 [Salvelinus fontinalis]
MAVNLSKNRLALLTAYQDVINETSSTDWALYTYEDNSNDLTLASSGAGGLPEITVTFDNGRVMYGFCSLKEPTAALPRYVLINWVGEDVPDARKCQCASHVADVAEFFQGVNIIVNASTIDDIEPSAIGQRLTNGTASVASPVLSRLRTREEENGELGVGTVYTKTNAEIEMKKINREEFWEQAKREEELRKEEERKKVAEERQRFEEERMELEKKEQEDREKRYRERERQIEEHRKKMQEEEEAKERTRNQPLITAEPSYEDLEKEKKETEVEEAKALIAQRADNPREFFKQKEKAVTTGVDVSPVSIHRAGRLDSPLPGRLDSPFLKQQHSPSEPSPPPLCTPPHARLQPAAPDGDDEGSSDHSMGMSPTPIPKIVTTPIQEAEDDSRNEWGEPKQQPGPVQESTPTKPIQSVAPQTRPDSQAPSSTSDDYDPFSGFRPLPAPTAADPLVDLWDSSPATGSAPSQALPPGGRVQPLLSFDEMGDVPFYPGGHGGAEDEPSSLVDVAGTHDMTLSYQHALQHASDDTQLMTNGETLLKEGTQASEGYFSQSQEEEDCSAKMTPTPVFYNKPPEIDITCWDTDPVMEDSD